MKQDTRMYLCIDMKTFYASVECAERGLNPFETDLVVADQTRGRNALCLAISPKMKARGIKNRCRLSDIPSNVSYMIAMPRMQKYIDYAADIYYLYLHYFSPQDIYVYSIDESFIDVTCYLSTYGLTAEQLAKKLMNEIANTLHIPSTAGIGTNLFLAKVALDITAKHSPSHIGYLDEELFRRTLWLHTPLEDFWQISTGTVNRLRLYDIHTMRDIADTPEELLYKIFGVEAEFLIDHAWGREPCQISDIKNYTPKSKSISSSQVLPRDYTYKEARVVMREMVLSGCQEMMRRKVISGKISIWIGYSGNTHEGSRGSVRLTSATAVNALMQPFVLDLFDKIVLPEYKVRRLGIAFVDVVDEGCEGYDLFTDWAAVEKEKAKEKAILELMDRYGKNAVLRGTNLLPSGTQRERNGFIGGHRA